ncbi:fibrous sheath CABYR-binding protein isoform X1 [Drosophila gunungcola]|nr:fibrous sheath CABYR-binding protein isoform X1 [Drosophila gunungcola]
MFLLAAFCLALTAMGGQARPLEPTAQHIVIVTPQAQVHLEPALRYVHGLSPLARVSSPHHHEETIVYVPAGTAAQVVPVVDAVGSGRAGGAPETKQWENTGEIANQIQQVSQQGVEIVSGQLSEAAASAASAGAGFFPSLFPPSGSKKEEKIELIETPANTQPLIATEARHFYSIPQVYHTPVVDVVHGPVYTWPISAIRARSIQQEPEPELVATDAGLKLALKAEPQAEIQPEPQALLKEQLQPLLIKEQPQPLPQPLPQALPLLKEQHLEQAALEQQKPIIAEASEPKAEFAGRLLESNAIKQELKDAEIAKEQLKEDPAKIQQQEELIKAIPAEPLPKTIQPEPLTKTIAAEAIQAEQPQQQEIQQIIPAQPAEIVADAIKPLA